jgi:hypothetical protein
MAGARALSFVVLAVVTALAPVSDGEMRVETDKLLAALGALRHLAPRGTLERRVVTRAEARAERDATVAAATGGADLAARARLWERLGLLPSGSGYAHLVAGRLDAAPTASYDPLSHRLVVPDWIPLPEQRTVLAHALVHALDDQRFGLRETLQIGLDGRHHLDGDAERARLALVEGEASVAALELVDARGVFANGHALAELAEQLRAVPPGGAAASPAWVWTNAAFAHADGLLFVARVRARQRWSAVDALWADPPQSSEQILHPEKYDARERPVSIEALPPHAFGDDWNEAGADVLGELGVRAWLARAVSEEVAARAAAGWGGDRAVLYERAASVDAAAPRPVGPPARTPTFVAWSTVWDDVTDAEDFARTASAALSALPGAAELPPLDDKGHAAARGADGVYALTLRGTSVAVLLGAPESALPVLSLMLGRVKKIGPAPGAGARTRGFDRTRGSKVVPPAMGRPTP